MQVEELRKPTETKARHGSGAVRQDWQFYPASAGVFIVSSYVA